MKRNIQQVLFGIALLVTYLLLLYLYRLDVSKDCKRMGQALREPTYYSVRTGCMLRFGGRFVPLDQVRFNYP